jgi:hypothetical protein
VRLFRLLMALALILTSFGAGSAAPVTGAPPLRLHRAILESLPSNRSPIVGALLAGPAGPYSIVQFGGPIAPADRAALEATGVKLLEYIPDFAYLVRGTPEQLGRAAGLPAVVSTSALTPADKLSPALLQTLARGASDVGQVSTIGWPDDTGALARALQTLPFNAQAPLKADMLLRIANLESVRWIEPVSRPRLLNDAARSIMHVDTAWRSQSLYGAGQIVAVLDSGLDVGMTPALSPDFAGRIVATHLISAGGDIADQNGHGTHVAGSVAGAGVQSGAITATHQYSGSFAGVAPEAGLVIQAFEADQTGQTFGLGPDYYPLYDQAYADGARLHSNSWGDYTGLITNTQAAFGGYPYGAQRTDQFVWNHPDMTIFFAAGNSGKDGTPSPPFNFCTGGDGVVDPDSLLSPGTAKNVVTVGASESYRTVGGLSGFPWLLLDFCFATVPIATDLVSNNPSGMAAFSSRGPTDDGRIKPDIVAPGTNIVSNQSHEAGASTLWGPYETNFNYAYSGGTSMATPLAAGVGVLTRQWLGLHGLPNPSAAAVKATLLDTTDDMAPGQYGTGLTQEIPITRPNSVNGWGRADLAFTGAAPPYALWVDDHLSGLATAQVFTYTHTPARSLQVMTNTQPLRVMLVWTDPPASLSASAALVNDLDLVVLGPNNAVYHGNGIAAGDRTNNVEGVIVNNPALGSYTVRVSAYNVPIASQPYALVVAGPIGSAPTPLIKLWLPLVIR